MCAKLLGDRAGLSLQGPGIKDMRIEAYTMPVKVRSPTNTLLAEAVLEALLHTLRTGDTWLDT